MVRKINKIWTVGGGAIYWSDEEYAKLMYLLFLNDVCFLTMESVIPEWEFSYKRPTHAQKKRVTRAYKRKLAEKIREIESSWGGGAVWCYGDLIGFISYMRYTRPPHVPEIDMSKYDHIQVSTRDLAPHAHAERMLRASSLTRPAT